jgi:tartrate dehydrogenase/decarboxylase/D-malate dehydrogenase
MMLEHLGQEAAAAHLMRSMEEVIRRGATTPDVGGTSNTSEVSDEIVEQIRRDYSHFSSKTEGDVDSEI